MCVLQRAGATVTGLCTQNHCRQRDRGCQERMQISPTSELGQIRKGMVTSTRWIRLDLWTLLRCDLDRSMDTCNNWQPSCKPNLPLATNHWSKPRVLPFSSLILGMLVSLHWIYLNDCCNIFSLLALSFYQQAYLNTHHTNEICMFLYRPLEYKVFVMTLLQGWTVHTVLIHQSVLFYNGTESLTDSTRHLKISSAEDNQVSGWVG